MSADATTIFVWNRAAPAHESYVQAGRHKAPAPVAQEWMVEQRRDRDGARGGIHGPFHDPSTARGAAERIAGQVRSPDRPVRLSESAPPPSYLGRPGRAAIDPVAFAVAGSRRPDQFMSVERARAVLAEQGLAGGQVSEGAGQVEEDVKAPVMPGGVFYEEFVGRVLRGLG